MMNQKTVSRVLLASLLVLTLTAQAALRVFACEPEWGALAQELGGKLVEVSVATSALQDPHQLPAKPSLIARARNADLVVCTGAELEVGWLPVLLQQSGNAKVQAGQSGNFAAADFVRKLDVPRQLDRAQGDVHAAGNPHIQTDPRNIALVATALGARLAQLPRSYYGMLFAHLGVTVFIIGGCMVKGYEIEFIVLRGDEAELDHKLHAYLQAHPDVLAQYEQVKRDYAFSRREYQRHKDQFFAGVIAIIPEEDSNLE